MRPGALLAFIIALTMLLQPVLTALVTTPFTGEGRGLTQMRLVIDAGCIWVVKQAQEG